MTCIEQIRIHYLNSLGQYNEWGISSRGGSHVILNTYSFDQFLPFYISNDTNRTQYKLFDNRRQYALPNTPKLMLIKHQNDPNEKILLLVQRGQYDFEKLIQHQRNHETQVQFAYQLISTAFMLMKKYGYFHITPNMIRACGGFNLLIWFSENEVNNDPSFPCLNQTQMLTGLLELLICNFKQVKVLSNLLNKKKEELTFQNITGCFQKILKSFKRSEQSIIIGTSSQYDTEELIQNNRNNNNHNQYVNKLKNRMYGNHPNTSKFSDKENIIAHFSKNNTPTQHSWNQYGLFKVQERKKISPPATYNHSKRNKKQNYSEKIQKLNLPISNVFKNEEPKFLNKNSSLENFFINSPSNNQTVHNKINNSQFMENTQKIMKFAKFKKQKKQKSKNGQIESAQFLNAWKTETNGQNIDFNKQRRCTMEGNRTNYLSDLSFTEQFSQFFQKRKDRPQTRYSHQKNKKSKGQVDLFAPNKTLEDQIYLEEGEQRQKYSKNHKNELNTLSKVRESGNSFSTAANYFSIRSSGKGGIDDFSTPTDSNNLQGEKKAKIIGGALQTSVTMKVDNLDNKNFFTKNKQNGKKEIKFSKIIEQNNQDQGTVTPNISHKSNPFTPIQNISVLSHQSIESPNSNLEQEMTNLFSEEKLQKNQEEQLFLLTKLESQLNKVLFDE